jgi:hypothetical protein
MIVPRYAESGDIVAYDRPYYTGIGFVSIVFLPYFSRPLCVDFPKISILLMNIVPTVWREETL